MKIDSSSIRMDSSRFYTNTSQFENNTASRRIKGSTAYISAGFASEYSRFSSYAGKNNENQFDTYNPSEVNEDEPEYLGSDLYSSFYRGPLGITSVRNSISDFHAKLIEQIEELMERIKAQLLGQPYKRPEQGNKEAVLDLTSGSRQPGNLWVRQGTYTAESEVESTTFTTVGKVKTADGRTIDFNMSLNMSRAFIRETSSLSEGLPYILTDPLILNIDDAPETVSDQKWYFDLNGDGSMEEISQLAGGNAFLALDRDGNGKIDNGKELFGATTGNGFGELAEFDEDGNGWIDENDSIYEDLKVWRKDALGNDIMTGLKGSDIGAIYLGSLDTEFSHKNLASNDTKAIVRQTGFFLHESTGAAGIVQQVDFASRQAV